ncbi:MAG TPA: transcription antitermination factor NusB, partial [Acidobacteriota bacterium]|nr:transcription antitermination factor NusB [Acidobacteriota bacterium]
SSARPWSDVSPGAKAVLRMSLYQMWRMDRIPDHALVHDAVELAKRELGRGIDRYVNGVLRNLTRVRPWEKGDFPGQASDWVTVSLPEWLWVRWDERYGKENARNFALSMNLPPRAVFRFAGTPEQSASGGFVRSDLVPSAYMFSDHHQARHSRSIGKDAFHFQDEASQLIPFLLGPPAPGEIVWDACAAPGGKSAILWSIYRNEGSVVSSDLHPERAARLYRTLQRLGNAAPAVVVADACRPPPFLANFDAVLADVPCSGLGTIRRNPEIKWHFDPEHFAALQQMQLQILHSVSGAVRAGGRLLYSTCSTEPEENEQVISSFLSSHGDFRLEPPHYPPGIENLISPDGMVRTFPDARLWDGFFAALLVRDLK